MATLTVLLEAAKEFAREAGEMAFGRFNQPRELTKKGFRDFVTDADYAAQTMIVERVRERFPDHGFLAEEDDASLDDGNGESAEFIWIIDPIDGTTNYSRQIPLFCVSVGIARAGEPVVGVVYEPSRDELFWATKGGGAFCNDRALRTSEIDIIDDAIIAFDWSRSPEMRQRIVNMLNTLAHQPRTLRSIGAAAIAMCWIADGRIDGYVNFQLYAWDVGAAQLILSEAGGVLSGISAESFSLADPDSWHLATNGKLKLAISA